MLEEKDIIIIKSVINESIKANNVAFKEELRPVIREEVKNEVSIQLKPVKSDIRKIRKDQDMIERFFDEERVNLRKRMNRVEEVLQINTSAEIVS